MLYLYRVFLFEYRPLLTWHDHWLIETDFYFVAIFMQVLCALTALKGSRWTRPFSITWLLLKALSAVFGARYGAAHIPSLVFITELVPLALLFAPSVSAYLKTRPQIRVVWPGLGSVVRIVCCVFSMGVFSLSLHFMLASAPPRDSLASVRNAFTVPGIVFLATLFGTRRRLGAMREIGLALVACVVSNILLAMDFAILHVLIDQLHGTYVVWCWIVFAVAGVGLVVYAAGRGQHPEPKT
ncbi:hypothetical protein LFL96_33230 [Paraburkholderia sp. D15]|uniref:hypothetical protein n=1 Tax=Paraburkholderia sp. D15 TaxID=2880218 RepID=UPI002478DCFF|nr:hypothetical protein [Paraburkholderia sp. D15]WGS53036.1 hypothetical protein LFL96_33230 [Paraburkholderia sp. D15]